MNTDPKIARLESYENRTASFMVTLAFLYLIVFSIQVLAYPLPSALDSTLNAIGWVIWGVFVTDLIVRTSLAPRKLQYLYRHPIDVLACALPAIRGLRVLRVLTAGEWLIRRGSRLTLGRTALAFVVAVIFVAYVASLAVLDAERSASSASITSFGDAIWWSFETMSTVGYGDLVPVTFAGRAVAIGLMVIGISILGIVSATLASTIVMTIRGEEKSDTAKILAKLEAMESEVARLRADLQRREG